MRRVVNGVSLELVLRAVVRYGGGSRRTFIILLPSHMHGFATHYYIVSQNKRNQGSATVNIEEGGEANSCDKIF